MYCKNCGNQMDNNAAFCTNCGASTGTGTSFCQNCGQPTMPNAVVCTACGSALNGYNPNQSYAQNQSPYPETEQKSKLAAGLLGIFLGAWGIHNFYIGNTTRGVIQLLLTIFSCGIAGIWGFIEGILILAGSINTDANGVPFKD